jgi:Flp pilus assembly protein TadG
MKTNIGLLKRKRGVVAIMFGLVLVVLFGFLGLALDLGSTYNLKTELQNAADAAALAGAKDLNGTTTGINNAVASAKALAASNKYGYSTSLVLADADIGFASDPDAATWLNVGAAQGAPAGLLFIKVTTPTKSRNNWFIPVAGGPATSTVATYAVAGRFSIAITPIGVCALSTTKYGQLAHTGIPSELMEYGFRRGIAYDVININPLGAAPNKYLLNPLDVPSGANDNSCTPSNNNTPTARPFICAGNASIITTLPGYVYANAGMQTTLNAEFNARFTTGGSCTVPADANIKEYVAGAATPGWMNPAPGNDNQGVKLVDHMPFAPPTTATISDWGVLWSYNKALQYGSGSPPFTAYGIADWPGLYPTSPTAVAYPTTPVGAATPYNQTSGPYFQAGPGARDRRVLNLALIDCPTFQNNGKCSTLKVLGIGRFFMQVQADVAHNLYGEFAGLVDDAELTSDIKLYH